MNKFLCISLSSTIQRTITFEDFKLKDVNRSQKYREDASGKAVNTARVLNQLEKDCVTAVCAAGKENASRFKDLAKKDELNLITVETPGFTRECWTLLNQKDSSTTELVIGEPRPSQSFYKVEKTLISTLTSQIKKADAVLLAGSKPEFWSPELTAQIRSIAKKQNKLFMADYCGKDLLFTIKESAPDIIKINQEEYEKTFFPDSKLSPEELKASVTKKSSELKNIIVVTRGADSTYAASKGVFYEEPSLSITPVNTTACGDTFNAGFLYEYMNSRSVQKSLTQGTKCAALNAQFECPGTIKKDLPSAKNLSI